MKETEDSRPYFFEDEDHLHERENHHRLDSLMSVKYFVDQTELRCLPGLLPLCRQGSILFHAKHRLVQARLLDFRVRPTLSEVIGVRSR